MSDLIKISAGHFEAKTPLRHPRRWWRTVYWHFAKSIGHNFLLHVDGGFTLQLHVEDALARKIYLKNWEYEERVFMRQLLCQGDTMLDIGANIGLFALEAACRVGSSGRVIAFEPTARTFAHMVENVRINHMSNVTCEQFALSDVAGKAKLRQYGAGMDDYNSLADALPHAEAIAEVACVRLDEYLAEHGIGPIKFIKLDVEGWESRVLEGGKSLFSKREAPVVQVEFCDKNALGAGSSCADLRQRLSEFGYCLFRYTMADNSLSEEPESAVYPKTINLFAIKPPMFAQGLGLSVFRQGERIVHSQS